MKSAKTYIMVLGNYRHLLTKVLRGPVEFCVKHKITPNQISIAGFVVSIIAAVTYALPQYFLYNYIRITDAVWFYFFLLPPFLFLMSGYIDLMDGAVARKTGQVTKFGAFLDSTLDRISDAVVILGLMFSGMIWRWNPTVNTLIGFVCLTACLLISYTRSRAELEGVVMKGVGFMERPERVLILMFGYLVEWVIFAIEEYFFDGFRSLWFYPVFFLVFTGFCIHTLVARILWTYRWLSGKMPEKMTQAIAKHGQPGVKPPAIDGSQSSKNSIFP